MNCNEVIDPGREKKQLIVQWATPCNGVDTVDNNNKRIQLFDKNDMINICIHCRSLLNISSHVKLL